MYLSNNYNNASSNPVFGYKLHTDMLFEFISGIPCNKNDRIRLRSLSAVIDTPTFIVKECLPETKYDIFEKRLGDEILNEYPNLKNIKDEMQRMLAGSANENTKIIKIFKTIKNRNFSGAFFDVKLKKDIIAKIKSDFNIRYQKDSLLKK